MVSSVPDASPAAASEQYSGPKLGLAFFQGHREIHAVAHHLADFEGHGFEVAEFLTVFHPLHFICHHVMLKDTALRLPSSWRFFILYILSVTM